MLLSFPAMPPSSSGKNRSTIHRHQGFFSRSLAFTAAMSCFILTSGVAQAAPVPIDQCGPGEILWAGGPSDPNPNGFRFTGISGPSFVNPGGTCELANPFNRQATLDVDFEDNISDNSGIFRYSLESSVGTFLQVQIGSDTDGIGGTTSVTKEIFGAYDPGTDTFSNLIGTETSTNGSTQIITLTNQNLPKIYIRDTYSASGSTRLDNFTNSYLVPGPLPLLGAGAAFGFSRKLRSRIKATSNA